MLRSRAFLTLVVSFGLTSLTSYVVVNLVPLLGERGIGPGTAAAVLGVGGVGQVLAGMVRGIVTLLQATAVTDRWGARDYGTLSGVLAAPLTFTTAVAPFLGAALAVLLGSYAAMLVAMAAVGLAGATLSLGSVPRTGQGLAGARLVGAHHP